MAAALLVSMETILAAAYLLLQHLRVEGAGHDEVVGVPGLAEDLVARVVARDGAADDLVLRALRRSSRALLAGELDRPAASSIASTIFV